MIISKTYHDDSDWKKLLLSTFSSIDNSLSKELSSSELSWAFRRLFLRLTLLSEYHGIGTSEHLILLMSKLNNKEKFSIANEFLEIGKRVEDDEERQIAERRELQQELVHFSRIVDIVVNRNNYVSTNKRLARSSHIPVSLKVITELMTVVRSRLIQRGMSLSTPIYRREAKLRTRLSKNTELIVCGEEYDHLLFVASDNGDVSRQIWYLFNSLLIYLTPGEACRALIAYASQEILKNFGMMLVTPFEDLYQIISWNNILEDEIDDLDWCRKRLPKCINVPFEQLKETILAWNSLNYGINIKSIRTIKGVKLQIITKILNSPIININLEKKNEDTVLEIEKIMEPLYELLSNVGYVKSIESGHIHLDRNIDGDQLLGLQIGNLVKNFLSSVYPEQPPIMTPMIDDDHVLVQLTPDKFRQVFERANKGIIEYELIPESSPIIRSIITALFRRASELHLNDLIFRKGGNLYIEIDHDTVCELFEDVDGRCDNGCAFFELALLIYRSSPHKFNKYFHNRYKHDIHNRILGILDSDLTPDEKTIHMKEIAVDYYDITNPFNPDKEVLNIVNSILNNGVYTHINILEDYYEVQQRKVRRLIKIFNLPITLISIHFNARSYRINMEPCQKQ